MSPVADAVEGKTHGGGSPAGGSLREKRSPEPAYSRPPAPVLTATHVAHPVPAPLAPSYPASQPRSAADVGALHSIYGNAAVARAATSGEIAPASKYIAAPMMPQAAVMPAPKAAIAAPTTLSASPPAPFASSPQPVPAKATSTGGGVETKQSVSPTGHAMPPHVQQAIENSFSIDMDGVEIHADSAAQSAAGALSARAFAYGNHIFLGQNEKLSDIRLIAHEAAHVVQQKGVPTVLRSAPGQSDAYEAEADRAASAVERGEKFTVTERVSKPRVQRAIVDRVRNWIADKAYNIPGFRLVAILIGHNPINGAAEERSAANVLRGLVELLPVVGHQIEEALNKYGVFEKAGNWLEKQFDKLKALGRAIVKDWDDFIDDLGWTDIRHPIKVIEDGLGVFKRALVRIAEFIEGVISDIIDLIKEAILIPLGKLAKEKAPAAWDLLCAVLGKDPITKEPVERSPENLIGGFMKLIHQEEVWNNIKKANALPRAWAWFLGAIKGLIGFVVEIPSVFIAALKSLTLEDILILPKALIKLAKVFGNFILKFFSWAGEQVWTLLQIIFEVVAPAVMPYLKRVGAAFKSIIQNPIAFVKNLVAAAKLGFENFGANFLEHLKAGLIDWLTGSLPGVYIPKAISLPEMGKFAMSVLGITWAQIRAKIVKALGPNGDKIMTALETAFDIVVALVKGGPAAAWELIKEKLTNLKDTVIEGITSFVIDTIVKKAIPKIISMFIPGAGFISAIVSIYDSVKVFVQKLAKMAAAVKAFVDSIVEIAEGQIGGAAKKVETALAGLLSLAISFLAGFLGLGDIASKILAVIEKVRAAVDKALDTAIAWVVDKAKALFAKLFGKEEKPDERTEEQKKADLDKGIAEAEALQKTPNITEAEIRKGLIPIKQKYRMESLDLVVDKEDDAKETVHVMGKINPDANTAPTDVERAAGDSEKNPIDFEWVKPAAANYPPVQLAPADQVAAAKKSTGKSDLSLAEVKNLPGAFEASPTQSTSLGDITIGVTNPISQTAPGFVFQAQAQVSGDSHKDKVNRTLEKYGYNRKDNADPTTDGDHVMEKQLGGPDLENNVWPLNSSVNRSSGSRMKNQISEIEKRPGIKSIVGKFLRLKF
jgi:hypothetical protein